MSRGKAAVVAGQKAFFDGPEAPFSWQPEQVEMPESEDLALGTGPVLDADGKRVASCQSICGGSRPANRESFSIVVTRARSGKSTVHSR